MRTSGIFISKINIILKLSGNIFTGVAAFFIAQNKKGGKENMNKRIIIKTTLICIGIFFILSSAGIYFFSAKYELDTEKKYQVIVAEADIPAGSVITENMVSYKTIKESGLTSHMLQNSEQVVGMKVLSSILKGDYIPQYNLLPSDKWHKELF